LFTLQWFSFAWLQSFLSSLCSFFVYFAVVFVCLASVFSFFSVLFFCLLCSGFRLLGFSLFFLHTLWLGCLRLLDLLWSDLRDCLRLALALGCWLTSFDRLNRTTCLNRSLILFFPWPKLALLWDLTVLDCPLLYISLFTLFLFDLRLGMVTLWRHARSLLRLVYLKRLLQILGCLCLIV